MVSFRQLQWLKTDKYKNIPDEGISNDIKRLQKGEPIDYVIGWKDFLGCRIDLSHKPFIPRPETEWWAQSAIEDMKKSGKVRIDCLDLCAGSGCIGMAVLKHVAGARVCFVEKNADFLKQIYENLRKNGISDCCYSVKKGNLFSGLKGRFDYVVSNPPYVAQFRSHRVTHQVKKWEPKQAVFSPDRGLYHISKIINEAPAHLNPGGKLYCEFDTPQKKDIEKLLHRSSFLSWNLYKDQYSRWRYFVGMMYN